MKRHNLEEIAGLEQGAIKVIQYIGRACGFRYAEINEIVGLIQQKSEDYVREYEEGKAECYPIRVAFSAIIEHRKSKLVWYKPWIEHRLLQIQKRYCNWWEQFKPEVMVATRFVPDSFGA